jgi:hypothetical protein
VSINHPLFPGFIVPLSEFSIANYNMEAAELFSVKGLVAVVTGGGSGM